MYFHALIEETEAVFSRFSCLNKIELPNRFAKIEHTEYDGVLTLENHFYRLNDLGHIRLAHTYAPKINIIATFFFPDPDLQLPVYSMEFVMLGEKPIIALMDMACLLKPMSESKTVEDFMISAHAAYPEYSRNQPLPEWFDQCRSGVEFFFRPTLPEAFKGLSQLNLRLLQNLTELILTPDSYGNEDAVLHQNNIQAYKMHHRINSPGLRLMNRSFGPEWTQEYLGSYLFG
ncbi:MAG: hypothetical protein IPN42_05120 [Methylococcaceae bacterium]|nr:hypothetical protein [Methylococcaceae bacterium]